MPYNGSGVFSIVNTFVPGTTISSSQVNANFTDIATGLSDCLTRDGQAPMTAQLQLINGSASTPSLGFASEPTLGLYRSAAANIGVTGGLAVTGNLGVTGAIRQAGFNLVNIGEVRIWSGLTAPSGWILLQGDTLLRASYPDLWTFASTQIGLGSLLFTNGNGTTTFTVPDLRGRVVAGIDPSGTRLTSTTMTPDGNTMGAVGGTQTSTILTTNLPPQTPAGTNSTSTTTVNDVVRSPSGLTSSNATGGLNSQLSGVGGSIAQLTVNAQTFTGTAFAGQNSTPLKIVQPTNLFNFIMYAGA